jgi:heterodisulfide reductase subunit B
MDSNKCCGQMYHLLAKNQILGKNEKEAQMNLNKIHKEENWNEYIFLAQKLSPHYDRAMAQKLWDECCESMLFSYQ